MPADVSARLKIGSLPPESKMGLSAKPMRRIDLRMSRTPLILPLLLAQATLAHAQSAPQPSHVAPVPVTAMTPDVVASYDAVMPEADFIRREAMVPMRDGVKLYTVWVMK